MKFLVFSLYVFCATAFIPTPYRRRDAGRDGDQKKNRYLRKYTTPEEEPNNLKSIDNQINELVKQMQGLKNAKRELLSNTRGLKLHNSSDFSRIDDFSDDTHDFGEGEDEDEDEDFSGFFPFPHIKGIRVVRRIEGGGSGAEGSDDPTKSENFQVVRNVGLNFTHIGGYDTIKKELMQCADLLIDSDKYARFNVRVPKGLILEGPPGNGKTLLAKCFSGQINVSFIAVSGSQFQEKYVGVGASRVRELFKLALDNRPCIVFIDEIDALGRKRSDDDSSHNAERDTTLNELLVALDGYQNTNGVFLLASTNRIDLLDSALTRPGRIDKSVFVGLPDAATRAAIINIHICGKPHDKSVTEDLLIEMTQGCSGAQIENLLNEAMLLALRDGREEMTHADLEFIITRILVGFQSTESTFNQNQLYQISVHEMGHAVVGTLIANYRRLLKVTLNLWSPKAPGLAMFESESESKIHSKESLFSHIMVLLAGRIAEEVFFQEGISTGASHDLEQARKLAEEMILKYGMGTKLVYPHASNKYREAIDREIDAIIEMAYAKAKFIVVNSRGLIEECSRILMEDHLITGEQLMKRIKSKHAHLLCITASS